MQGLWASHSPLPSIDVQKGLVKIQIIIQFPKPHIKRKFRSVKADVDS